MVYVRKRARIDDIHNWLNSKLSAKDLERKLKGYELFINHK